MKQQLFVVHRGKLNPNPPAHANIGGSVKLLWAGFDQGGLYSDRRGQQYSNMPIVVMIVGTHCKDFFADEEGWFAMRKFFHRFGQGHTNSPDACQIFFALVELWSF